MKRKTVNKLAILLVVAAAIAQEHILPVARGSPNEPAINVRSEQTPAQTHHGISTRGSSSPVSSTNTQPTNTVTNAQQGPQPPTLPPSSLTSASPNAITNELSAYFARDSSDSIQHHLEHVLEHVPSGNPARHSSVSDNHHHHNHHHPNNHQNYPAEPYPSASYTSSITIPSNSTQNINSASSFLNREHHQLNNVVASSHNQQSQQSSSAPQQGQSNRLFTSGDISGNTFDAFSASTTNTTINFANQSAGHYTLDNIYKPTNVLNAGLIQDLTASLFPIRQLSNATLFSLSDLLNKTRNNHQPHQQHKQHNYHASSSLSEYPSNLALNTMQFSSPLQPQQQHQERLPSTAGFMDANFNDPQPLTSMFEFMKPSGSQIYQREQKKPTFQHQPAYFGPSNPLPAHKTASGLRFSGQYNSPFSIQSMPMNPISFSNSPTYTQTFQAPQMSAHNLIKPPAHNHQAESFYSHDTFLDAPNSYKQQVPLQMITSGLKNFFTEQQKPPATTSLGFHYVQQHSSNNQDHLDKIVYHSTPFRPSIANSPSAQTINPQNTGGKASMAAGEVPTSSLLSEGDKSALLGAANMKPSAPDNQDDNNKSVAFASFGSPSNTVLSGDMNNSSSRYSVLTNNNNGARATNESQPSTTFPSTFDEIDFDRFQSQLGFNSNKSNSLPTTSQSNNRDRDYQASDGASGSIAVPASNRSSSIPSSGVATPPGPAILFDLYEREVDNQIREALYGNSGERLLSSVIGHQHIGPSDTHSQRPKFSVPPVSTWFEKTPSASLSSDNLQSNLQPSATLVESYGQAASWQQPVALGVPSSYAHHTSPSRPSSIDQLAAALQDLPSLSATDLQPMFPASSSSYSLAPAASNLENYHENSSPNQQQLASLLATINSASDDSDMTTSPWASAAPNGNKYAATPTNSLPSIFFKLNSSPLASIFSSPLAHLYASLPGTKTRNNYKRPSTQHQQAASSPLASYFASPSSFLPLQTLASLSGKQLLNALSGSSETLIAGMSGKNSLRQKHLGDTKQHRSPIYRQFYHSNHNSNQDRQQQLQKAAIAAATAHLLAAAAAATSDGPSQTLTPLQATALIQGQSGHPSSSASILHTSNSHSQQQLHDEPFIATSSSLIEHQHPSGIINNDISSNNNHHSKGFGLVGGSSAISPFFWRNLLSPANWARKQSISSSATASQSQPSLTAAATTTNHHGSHYHQNSHQQNNDLIHHHQGNNAVAAKHHNHLSWSSLLGGSFFSPTTDSPITNTKSHSAQVTAVKHKPKTPTRVEIKILKIPVAFYDHQPSTSSNQQQLSRAIGLLPAASSLTSSLLSSIPCPLSHTHNNAGHSLASHRTSIDQRQGQLPKAVLPPTHLQRLPMEISSIIPHLSLTGTSFMSASKLFRPSQIVSTSPVIGPASASVATSSPPTIESATQPSVQRSSQTSTLRPSESATYSPPVAAFLDGPISIQSNMNSLLQDHLQIQDQQVAPLDDAYHRRMLM